MGFSNNIGEYKKYQFTIDDFSHIVGGDVMSFLPTSLKAFHVIDDYIDYIVPIIRITVVMSDIAYYRVIQHKNDGFFHIRIGLYFLDANGEKKALNRKFLDKTFHIITIENKEDLTRVIEDVDKINQLSQDELDLYNSQLKTCSIYLYDRDLVMKINRKVNYIFHRISLFDAFYAILTNEDINQCLVSPFQHPGIIEEIILPPMPLHNSIQYLSYYYGIYPYGSLLYFGLQRNYFLDLDVTKHIYENNETKVISILIVASVEGLAPNSGKYVNRDNSDVFYYRADSASIEFMNNDVVSNIFNGKDQVMLTPYEKKEEHFKSVASTMDFDNTDYVVNYTQNPFMSTTYSLSNHMSQTIIQLSIGNADIGEFTPNKEYRLLFEDSKLEKKYRGTYRLLSSQSSIFNANADYTSMVTLRLSKLE